ncbi:uncharacterized protein brk [Prorops nasuta]|uniref:uncharacterized protein brk n=1 Tax=Prorops nasuta TaxID=863751 RepID=UPI0034CE1FFB
MAHGVGETLCDGSSVKMVQEKQQLQQSVRKSVGVMGSRRIFAPAFKLKVLDSYRNDIDCRGNQRATARKYGIHRRQIQKWLQCEENLRSSCADSGGNTTKQQQQQQSESAGGGAVPAVTAPALNLSLARLHGDELAAGPPPTLSSRPPAHRLCSIPMLSLRSSPTDCNEYPTCRAPPHLPNSSDRQCESEHCFCCRVKLETANFPEETESSSAESGSRPPSHSYQEDNYDQRYRLADTYELDSIVEPGAKSLLSSVAAGTTIIDTKAPTQTPMTKTERRSPVDSMATVPEAEPCESSYSPGVTPDAPPPQPVTSTSVHFESPRLGQQQPAVSPHVHVREHAHLFTSLDSEKPMACQGEGDEAETVANGKRSPPPPPPSLPSPLRVGGGPPEADVPVKPAAAAAAVAVTTLNEEETRRLADRDSNNEDADDASSCFERDKPGGVYSLPSSPREVNSPERFSSSCSDSEEADLLDALPDGSRNSSNCSDSARRRSFSLRFKLDVLDAFHSDAGVAGNQRATARKFGINRRQVQKWLGQETELRGEIALRGNSRQRLGPMQEISASGELPVDLRTGHYIASTLPPQQHHHGEMDHERFPPYCWKQEESSPQRQNSYYRIHGTNNTLPTAIINKPCGYSCCVVDPTRSSTGSASCYQDYVPGGVTRDGLYCYSPKYPDSQQVDAPSLLDSSSSELKRKHCMESCCSSVLVPAKKSFLVYDEAGVVARSNDPPQETPLCLVKPKGFGGEFLIDGVARPAPPRRLITSSHTTPKKDGILFKPYLDNPVSKPLSTNADSPTVPNLFGNNNNNNCHAVCNMNEDRDNDYALELSLRVPVSWRASHNVPCAVFPGVRSAFVRYPASPHHT